MQTTPSIKDRIMAFVGLGIFLALIIVGLVIFSYILIIGALIGLVLFIIAFIYSKISGKKKVHHVHIKHESRVIDHDADEK